MNNNPNNNLNDFLNKNKQGLEDDFEKDAFAGFETLASKEEGFELKSGLDKKISQKLFQQKKQNFYIVWYAAASLFLIIGFSAFYILYFSNKIIETKNVSLIEDTKKEETVSTFEQLKTINTTSTEINEIKAAEKNEAPALLQSKVDANKAVTTNAKIAVEKSEKKQDVTKQDEFRIIANKSAEAEESKKTITSNLDNLALSKSKTQSNQAGSGKLNDEVATNTPAKIIAGVDDSEGDKDVVLNEAETTTTNNSNSNNYTSGPASEAKDKAKDSDAKKEINSREVVKANKSTYRKKSRADESPKTQPSVTATIEQQNQSVNSKSDTKPTTNTKPVDASDSRNQCYYAGGEIVLIKDVGEKLNAKNLIKKFDAVLIINEKKQVEKVNFTNSFNLTPDEKKIIENELKTLNKFNFYISPTIKTWVEFKLEYRP